MPHAAITALGSYLPERRLTNQDLERMVDTTDEWIVTRTGIRERRVAADGEATSDLAARAGTAALTDGGLDPGEIDLLVLATSSPDKVFPSTATLAQKAIGLSCPAYDAMAACSGFVFALHVATSAIESERATRVLLIGADAFTRLVDFEDRSTCVLFGDGAGAVVLEASEEPGVMGIDLGTDGSLADILEVPAGGTALPLTAELCEARQQYVRMNGNEVFRFAVGAAPGTTLRSLEASGLAIDDVDWLILHQANQRILDAVGDRLGLLPERVYSNIERNGNTSTASIPLALDDLYTGGHLRPGSVLSLVGFGAGVTWGAATVRWTKEHAR